MTVSELCATIVTTFKAIANFNSDEYTTDELARGDAERDCANLYDYFERLMNAYETVECFPANTTDELDNMFFIGDIKSRGLETALMDYANGDIVPFSTFYKAA